MKVKLTWIESKQSKPLALIYTEPPQSPWGYDDILLGRKTALEDLYRLGVERAMILSSPILASAISSDNKSGSVVN